MSQFYDQASLVMVPSGYKAGKVYSQKPLTTDGQLTFTRTGDTATRVNADGLVEKVRTNLALYSQAFTNAVYGPKAGTFTDNYGIAPDGTQTACRWVSTNSDPYIYQPIVLNGTYTASVWVKGVVGYSGKNMSVRIGGFANLVPLTNEWQRVSVTGTYTATINCGFEAPENAAVGDEVLIWGFQVETGDIATDYIPTTSAAVSVGPVANLPRIDYTGATGGNASGCGKLLLEPQRVNVCLWSEQINNAGWPQINTPTITANIATAPDGYGGADGIQDTTGGTFKRVRQTFTVTPNQTHTASVFVKKETTQTNFGGISLTFTGTSSRYAYGIINPITGTIVVSSDSLIASTSTKVEDYGAYWRFSLTATDNQSNSSLEIAYYATLSTNGTITGVGAGSVRTVWGFQLEIGASYATSYIPTLSAAVTRGADAAYKTGISSLIGQTEGTLFLDFVYNGKSNNLADNFNLTVGTWASNIITIGQYNNALYARIYESSTLNFNNDFGNMTIGQRYKVAIAYASNDAVFYVNGSLIGSDTSVNVPLTSDLSLNRGSFENSKEINQALLFKTRLSNADLATLTTL